MLAVTAMVVWAQAFSPAPPDQVAGYWATTLPCRIEKGGDPELRFVQVTCDGDVLEHRSLRELAILRNTIYARYGWDGFRKPWLREHFQRQPWFHPNPSFNYKLLSQADRKNAHFIGSREASFSERELRLMRAEVYARHGKVWDDVPVWRWKSGKTTRGCQPPDGFDGEPPEAGDDDPAAASSDCAFAGEPWYHPDRRYSDDRLTAEDRIELGLISRQLGSVAIDGDRKMAEKSLDAVLDVKTLRQLSMRDLRILRNTVYARRGRPFRSEVMRDHFRRMRWYHENTGYTDALLTANDRRNIRLIKSVEDEMGGPLGDEDWLIEPSLDGA